MVSFHLEVKMENDSEEIIIDAINAIIAEGM